MEDCKIVDLYWQRNEDAIQQTQQKYEHYLTKIAYNVLSDWEDSSESVSDTYFKAWNSMPPQKPCVLSTYLGKITRQSSIDLFRKKHSQKRQESQYAISLSELEDCLSEGETTEEKIEMQLLADAISKFLRALPPLPRSTFIGRYYFMDSVKEISVYCRMSESKTKSMLHRTRLKLKDYLAQEGFYL